MLSHHHYQFVMGSAGNFFTMSNGVCNVGSRNNFLICRSDAMPVIINLKPCLFLVLVGHHKGNAPHFGSSNAMHAGAKSNGFVCRGQGGAVSFAISEAVKTCAVNLR